MKSLRISPRAKGKTREAYSTTVNLGSVVGIDTIARPKGECGVFRNIVIVSKRCAVPLGLKAASVEHEVLRRTVKHGLWIV